MDDTETFRTQLLESVRSYATVQGNYSHSAFVAEMAGRLIEAEEISDWTPCSVSGKGYKGRKLVLDGFLIDDVDLDNSVSLIIADFRNGDTIETLTATQASTMFDQALNFVEDAFAGRLHEELEQATAEYDLAFWLYTNKSQINSIRVFLISDAVLSQRSKELPQKEIAGTRVELHIWDIARFHRTEGTGGREPIEIDLKEFVPEGFPTLRATIGNTGYDAYLCVVPGSILADLYDRYGSRLLEGNVRSFLSVRGGVNKGIRNTILNEPARFFAYNNGVTATASSATLEEKAGQLYITSLCDLQIVNGGQTTASLFTARRKDATKLEGIFVQLKLSVVTQEQAEELIPKISEYANSQNKVSAADLTSNHVFHLHIKELSKRLWAPVKGSAVNQTMWFYERARGEYLNEQNKLSPAKKKEFTQLNPKNQLITKTDLGKYENSWAKLPHIVSLGAQKNYTKFAEKLKSEWDARKDDFNERWFKHLVAKAILFSTTEEIVSAQPWYTGGYRANIVTYTVARLVQLIETQGKGKTINFDGIWKQQDISEALRKQITAIAKHAFDVIVNPPGAYSNITEWCKKEACWKLLSETDIALIPEFAGELIDISQAKEEKKDARKLQKNDNTIAMVEEVVKRGPDFWRKILTVGMAKKALTPKELDLVKLAVNRGRNFVPSDAQARVLLTAAEKLSVEVAA